MLHSADITIQKETVYSGHKAAVYKLIPGFKPNSFLSAAGDGIVAEWQIYHHTDAKALAVVSSSIFSMLKLDATSLIAIGQLNGSIQIMDIYQKKELANLQQSDHAVYDMLLHNHRVYAASADGYVYCFDCADFALLKVIRLSDKSIRCLTLAENRILAGASDASIYYIHADFSVQKVQTPHHNSIFSLCYVAKTNRVISGSRDAQLGINTIHPSEINFHSIPAHLNTINHIALNPHNSLIATASRDRTIKLWDAENYALLKVLDAKYDGHKNSVNNVFWTADNKFLISCGDDRQIIRWSVKTDNKT
ncbi:MAG: WD40 repeat domain-containing protein [Chitinophagales bacterium]